MTYYGQFQDVDGILYDVRFDISNGVQQSQIITLGAAPVILETVSDGLFAPIKSRLATIQIVSDDFLFDIYSRSEKGTKVTINSAEKVIYQG